MKWLNCSKIKVLLVVFVAAVVLGGGNAKADFVIGEATCVDKVINNGNNTQECSFLHDGLKLYFTNDMPGGHGGHDIWVASREAQNAPWEEPINLGPTINSGSPCYPAISPDELELYFHTSWNSTVLMRSTRVSKDGPWGPTTLFTGLGEPACDLDISADGLTVYFDSDRSGGYGGWDIWMATRETVDSPWGEPVNLGPNVNNAANQSSPSISNDDLALFYNNGGLKHISVATRSTKDDEWGPPVLLGPAVNGGNWQHGAEISPDGSVLYFDSDRSGGFNNENFWQVPIIPIVDFNSDEIVDLDDLLIMIDNWGTDESLCDIGPMPWGDGIVDKEDIKVLMSYWGQEILPDELIALWKLDEIEGNIASDSISGNDGTLYGEPIWQPEGGMINGALELDGIDDYISTPLVLKTSGDLFSIFVWVKDGMPGQVIFSQKGRSNWLSADSSDGSLKTELRFLGKPDQPLLSQVNITDDEWHRVGLVWDGSNRILYVDDVEVASDTYIQGPILGDLQIGAGKNLESVSFWSGLIDDVRIYNRAITP